MTNTAAATRPAFLSDAGEGAAIAFRLVRIDAETDRIARDGAGDPIFDDYAGTVTSYTRDNDHRPHPVVRFTLDTTGARVFTARPDFHITAAS
jgi:hypothetical protein